MMVGRNVKNMIIFNNTGLIDLKAIRVFGLHAKIHENPLGFFGLGLKQAIAILLRTNHQITLYRGYDKYTFKTLPSSSRGKDFDFVYMDGVDGSSIELPFTLELAKTWEVWQAYREFHSNTLDEKGVIFHQVDNKPYIPTSPDQTTFIVSGEGIENAYNQRDKIFLNTPVIAGNSDLEVHAGKSDYVYYRGVQVMKLQRPSLYTYNLLNLLCGLSEDRTLKSSYDIDYYASRFFQSECEDRSILETILIADSSTFEGAIYRYAADKVSPLFLDVYRELREGGHAAALNGFATSSYLSVHKTLPLPAPIILSKIQQKQLDKAIAFCLASNWRVTDYPIVVVPQAHGGLLALAEGGRIVLTTKLFDIGTKEVVSALIEEYHHLKFGYKDETRDYQTFLLRQLVNAQEQIVGEPL